MKKKTAVFISAAVIAAAAVTLLYPDSETSPTDKTAVAAANPSQRIEYFASHGWEVEEIAGKSITIPGDFSAAYEEYALIQDKQGLPLREYAGRDAMLYVYQVKNYSPESKKILAELLVCDDTAVASMVYSEDAGGLRLSVS